MSTQGSQDHYDVDLAVLANDLFMNTPTHAGDIAFYIACADQFGGPILEVGAGTGRVLFPLAEAGYQVTGLDLSSKMLARAQAHLDMRPELHDKVHLVHASMVDFDLSLRFQTILVTARSFMHVTSPADQRAALTSMRDHLLPGGHLVLDLFDPDFSKLFDPAYVPPVLRAEIPGTDHMITRERVDFDVDPAQQRVVEHLRFTRYDGAMQPIDSADAGWTLRWSLRQEIAYLLELTGFEPIALYGDFFNGPPAYGQEQLWIARGVTQNE